MSNTGEPSDPQNVGKVPPWSWDAPVPFQRERQDRDWTAAKPPTYVARFSRSSVSPLAPFVLVFILGAILGGVGGYQGGRATSAQPVVVATPVSDKTSAHSAVVPTPVTDNSQVYTVTGINGTIIEAVGPNNVPISIFTNRATTYQEGGLSAPFTDIKPGSVILVKGYTGTKYARTAARILLQNAIISGTIQAVSSSGIDVTVSDGSTVTLSIASATKIVQASTNQPINLGSLNKGEKATAFGEMVASEVFGAEVIDISA